MNATQPLKVSLARRLVQPYARVMVPVVGAVLVTAALLLLPAQAPAAAFSAGSKAGKSAASERKVEHEWLYERSLVLANAQQMQRQEELKDQWIERRYAGSVASSQNSWLYELTGRPYPSDASARSTEVQQAEMERIRQFELDDMRDPSFAH